MENKSKKIENSLTVVVASKSTGSTTENKKHINRYIKEKKKQGVDYRVLVIDFNDEYKGTKIDLDELTTFKNKVAIVGNPEMTLKERIKLLEWACAIYKNGLLIIDDFSRLGLKGNKLHEIIGRLCAIRTFNIDVVIALKSLNVPVKLLQNASYVRFHYNIEKVEMYKKRLHNFDLYKLAQQIVRYKITVGYELVNIDLENNSIFGCSKSDYLEAYKDLVCDKVMEMKNIEEISNIPHYLIGVEHSNMKHIPISNINRNYIN